MTLIFFEIIIHKLLNHDEYLVNWMKNDAWQNKNEIIVQVFNLQRRKILFINLR